jgi:hypothetical protein
VTKPYQDRDVTLTAKHAGPGMGFTRNCFSCKENRTDRGGKTDKRTKMWNCADCVAAKEERK